MALFSQYCIATNPLVNFKKHHSSEIDCFLALFGVTKILSKFDYLSNLSSNKKSKNKMLFIYILDWKRAAACDGKFAICKSVKSHQI
jgi:hypothetical protein